MKVLFHSFYYLVLAGVLLIGMLLVASLVKVPGNVEVKVVKSGSMEPAIKTGSIVLVRVASSYKVGDIITFGPDTKTQIPTTHRIIAQKGEGASKVFTTKGDANKTSDPGEVKLSEVDGKVIFTIPYAGYVLDFAKQPMGFALLVGLPAAAIIIEEVGNIIRELLKMRRKKKQEGTHRYARQLPIPQKPQRIRVE